MSQQKNNKIEIIQTGSVIGRQAVQARRLKALGFGSSLHAGRKIVQKDCPNVRALLKKVDHLVKWQEI